MEHVTIPLNSYCASGKLLHKIWKVRNVGTEPWPEDTTVTFVNGDLAPVETLEPTISSLPAPGEVAQISVPFRVPAAPGKYRASYRLTSGDKHVSDLLDIFIVVPADQSSSAPSK